MNIPKYISAEAYSKQSGLGVEEVKRLCRSGEIKCLRTEGGYYKIPIYEDSVSIEEYEKAKEEITKLKTTIENILATAKQVI